MSLAEFFEVEYRLDGVDEEHPWTRLPRVPVDNESFTVRDLELGKKYNVRWRHVDEAGAFSPWTTAPTQTVRSRLPPPPDVVDVQVTDDDCLSWRLEEASPFVQGFEIRTAPGDHRHWDSAEPVSDRLWPAPPFPLCGVLGGQRTFLVAAVDVDGQRSEDPTVVIVTRGALAPVKAHELYSLDFQALNYPGVLVGAARMGGSLQTLTSPKQFLWPRGVASMVPLWDATAKARLWNDGPLWPRRAGGAARLWDPAPGATLWGTLFGTASYTMTVPVPVSALGAGARLAIDIAATPTGWRLEYRRQSTLLWGDPGVPKAPLWDPAPGALLWPRNEAPWLPWTGKDDRVGAGVYQFRLVLPSGLQPSVVTTCKATVSVDDRSESFTALPIAAAGTRLPISAPFHQISGVRNLVVRAGSSATNVLLQDVDPFLGPMMRCIDQAGAFVAGVIDATVDGW